MTDSLTRTVLFYLTLSIIGVVGVSTSIFGGFLASELRGNGKPTIYINAQHRPLKVDEWPETLTITYELSRKELKGQESIEGEQAIDEIVLKRKENKFK